MLNAEESSRGPGEKGLKDAGVLAKGAGVSVTGGVAAQGLSVICQILIARLLGAADFGLYSLGWTLVRLFPPLTTLNLDAGVTYFGSRYLCFSREKFKGVVRQSITISFLSGLTVGTALYLAAPALARHVFVKPEASPVIRAFAAGFPLYAVLLVGGSVTTLSHRMQYLYYSSAGLTASALVFFCVLFVFGCGLMGAVLSTVGGIAVGAWMSIHFVKRLFPVLFAKEVKPQWTGGELLAYCAPLVLSGLASSGLAFADRLFVAAFCTSAQMGIYQAASQMSLFFAISQGAFHNIFSPMAADLHARGEKERLRELYRVCAKWALYTSMPVFLVVLFAPVELVKLVYGSAYVQAAIPLVILSFGRALLITSAASGPALLMTGQQKIFMAIPLAVLPVDLLLNFILVPSLGLAGAATAAAISSLVLNAAAVVAVRRQLGVWPFDARYIKPAVAVLMAAGLLYLVTPLITGAPALRLLIVAGLSLAAFAGCLAALGLEAEDQEIVGLVWARCRCLVLSSGVV